MARRDMDELPGTAAIGIAAERTIEAWKTRPGEAIDDAASDVADEAENAAGSVKEELGK